MENNEELIEIENKGKTISYRVLFSFKDKDEKRNFMVLTNANDSEDDCFVVECFEDGTLSSIDDEEIIAQAQEMLDILSDSDNL